MDTTTEDTQQDATKLDALGAQFLPLIPGETLSSILDLTANIVAAYVGANHIAVAEVPGLLTSVHGTLVALDAGPAAGAAEPEAAAPVAPQVEKPTPQQVKKSIKPEGLVSFIDGKSYKTLRRHLTKHGLTPETYRERYGLPADYPLVSASYSAERSALAKSIGLGVPGSRAKKAAEAA